MSSQETFMVIHKYYSDGRIESKIVEETVSFEMEGYELYVDSFTTRQQAMDFVDEKIGG